MRQIRSREFARIRKNILPRFFRAIGNGFCAAKLIDFEYKTVVGIYPAWAPGLIGYRRKDAPN